MFVIFILNIKACKIRCVKCVPYLRVVGMASASQVGTFLAEYVDSQAKYCDGNLLERRRRTMAALEELVKEFVVECGKIQNIEEDVLSVHGSCLLPFGGQQVGLITVGSDIDAVCIVPKYIKRDTFFKEFPAKLERHSDVSQMRVIEAAYVPVIKLIFQEIQFDICFAKLNVNSIPRDLDVVPTDILKGMDPECVRSINGIRETNAIIEAVPDFEIFIEIMKIVKYWAKIKAIYGTAMGYLGGIGWTLLVAHCCQKNPRLTLEKLLQQFFYMVANWTWPQPLLLKPLEKDILNLKSWNPQVNTGDLHHIMPIITPVYPEHNCAFTVLESTKIIITECLHDACSKIDAILDGNATWETLFQPAPFFSRYKHFLMVVSKACTEQDHIDWTGLVEARLRLLVASLEKQQSIRLAHPCSKSFPPAQLNSDLFQSIWLIGLQFISATGLHLDLANDIQNFNDALTDAAHVRKFYKKGMKIEVKHVKRKQLSQFISEEHTIF